MPPMIVISLFVSVEAATDLGELTFVLLAVTHDEKLQGHEEHPERAHHRDRDHEEVKRVDPERRPWKPSRGKREQIEEEKTGRHHFSPSGGSPPSA